MDPILQGLNEPQQDAVTSPSNVLQILAPPGSGKTKTLTSRVAYLLQHHRYKPWDIICLTFTVKSSREMKERIAKLLGSDTAKRLVLGTFHSVCRRYLVTYGHLIGLHKGFGIADSSDSTAIIKRIIKRLGLKIDAKKAQSRISSCKSKGLHGPDQQVGKQKGELAQQLPQKKNVEQQEFSIVFEEYQSQLAKSNLLDYDDLLLSCVDLLRQNPTCVSNVEVVLIDEFQDTNVVQFDLMRLFAAKNKRVTTVGDPDQSIYGWRSAEIKNLERMQQQYPGMITIHLKDNYRSSGAVLLAADEVIQQDTSRPAKSLLPTHCPGTMPVLRRLPTAEIEALWIVFELQRMAGLTGRLLAYSDFAVLLRTASLSRQVESAMGRAGIPYRMVGGKKFFDRLEVKILLDYLRVVSQPNNNDAISRIINTPARGLGATTVKALLEEAETRKLALWTLLRNSTQNTTRTNLSKAAKQGLGSFVNLILTSRNKILDTSNPDSPKTILGYIIEKLDFQNYLQKSHPDDSEARWANVEELTAQASEFTVCDANEWKEDDDLPNIEGLEQQRGNAAEEALAKFLANVALASELQKEEEDTEGKGALQSQVTISTIHAAKGLEWPVVFVPSAYEGCIPHSRAEDTDEERRLLYVAMTRAQALLYISCPMKNSQREETAMSPFLSTKPVTNLLVSQGPTINSSTVNDIARILRRDSPTQAQISEACETLKSVHDNLWPLTGEEEVKATGARRSKWDSNESSEHPYKRRRMQDSERSVVEGMTACANPPVAGHIGSTTTMQSSSTFSYNTGFISAATQLQHVDEHKKMDTMPNRGAKPSKVRKEEAKLNSKSSFAQGGGQGNLMSFFGMKAGKHGRSTPSDQLAEGTLGNLVAGRNHTSGNVTVTGPTATTNQVLVGRLGPTSRTPNLPLPEALATHRLQPLSNTNRPRPLIHEEEPLRKKPYVFLSSSPPHIEELVEAAENQCEHQSPPKMISRVEDSEVAPRHTDIVPSRTFHTTSIARLQTEVAPRKTLGVRRSMNGWSAGGSHGFSVPKMNGSKR
ncbi:hypothetical protein HO133_008342 [Letharia lupina]|uniref:DNA 3'-5' helicase n=1 Tax=Letharia lupina TaxID=560253 RepID=A0A8H6CPE0_9LECA|nr:uncharacterized protein HO133_008342 [Letharia lupina]KAF6226901.1 hypothetical protein HO133_008342 [Letharia lupina]